MNETSTEITMCLVPARLLPLFLLKQQIAIHALRDAAVDQSRRDARVASLIGERPKKIESPQGSTGLQAEPASSWPLLLVNSALGIISLMVMRDYDRKRAALEAAYSLSYDESRRDYQVDRDRRRK